MESYGNVLEGAGMSRNRLFELFVLVLLATGYHSAKGGDLAMDKRTEIATFGGGCFWCLEAVFERIDGVKSVISGYAGGSVANPTYEQVCAGGTGHAEVIQVEYDPTVITYDQLLDHFWSAHDPTTKDRQGADVGSQYRSVILYANEQQRIAAEQSKAKVVASGIFSDPVVTEIVALKAFTMAEGYHQDYFRNNPNAPYCVYVIKPKLKKLEHK
jgi:peptide-methionine (S)-S-oxide reductase